MYTELSMQRSDMEKRIRIHINCPYKMLKEEWERFLTLGISPEVYFTGEDLDRVDRKFLILLRDTIDSRDDTLSIHAPYMDLNPGAVDERIRDVTLYRFEQVMDIAEILKPERVVFHPGFDRWRYDGHEDIWLKQSIKTWRPMLKRAEALNTVLAIENVFEERPDTLVSLVESISSSHFRLCFDIGHFTVFSKVSLREWCDAVSPYLSELHLHDNHGTKDEHIAIGNGIVDFSALFELIKGEIKSLIITYEPHREEDLKPGIDNLKRLLKRHEDRGIDI